MPANYPGQITAPPTPIPPIEDTPPSDGSPSSDAAEVTLVGVPDLQPAADVPAMLRRD